MAIDAERLIINLSADFKKFERDMRKASEIGDKQFRAIEKSAERTQAKLKGFSLSGLTKGLGVLSAGFLGVQGARQIAEYAENYVNLQNSLKVTGLEGKALADVFKQLTEISLRQGAPLDALVTLYSRASQSAKELNASQGDLIKFSDGIATALRVAGTSAGEAQGALLQLGQALGAGVVRAEEFNSVNEGARPILQAVANGLKEAGGSVSTLRGLVLDGKVSSEAFFRAFLAGSGDLRKQAALTAPTVSQSMERIKTAMTVLVGELDKTVSASANAADALNAVAAVIEAMPGFINSAAKGLKDLQEHLNKLDKHSFFGQIRDALRYDPSRPSTHPNAISPNIIKQILPRSDFSLPIQPQPGAAGRFRTIGGAGYLGTDGQGGAGAKGIAQVTDYRALKVTADAIVSAGTSATAMASAQGNAKVSIEDFAVAASNAAGKLSAIDTEVAGAYGDVTSSYVNNVVAAESGGKANAKNPNSTATGLGQFIESTWVDLFKKNFPELAKGKADSDILKLRSDAAISKQLIEAYAKENAAVLAKAGVSVNEAALHLSHFLGAGDAAKVLKAAPGTPLAGLISQASINANPTILGGGRTVDDARAYAERRAGNTRRAAGNFTPAEEKAKDQVKSYQDLVAGSVEYIASQDAEAKAIGKTSFEAAKLQHAQDLLNQASQAGLEITPALKAQIDQLAAGMANADIAANGLAASNKMTVERLDEFRDSARDVLGGFISDLREGKSASEALGNALASIGDKLLDSGINSLIDSLFGKQGTSGTGLFGGIFSALGFADGGYTGNGGKNEPAGIVHKGEYVVPKSVVGRIGAGNLQRAFQGYASGGLVGMRAPNLASASAANSQTHVTVGVSADSNGNLMPFVESVVQKKTPGIVQAGIGQYDKKLNGTIGNKLAQNQERQ
jgi:tape measure domain-containing protein